MPLGRIDLFEAAHRPAAVQVVVGEAAADQRGHLDPGQVRHQRLPPLVAQWPLRILLVQRVFQPRSPQAVAPNLEEADLPYAARSRQVAVDIGPSLPWDDRLQVRW